ncbi:MAG: UDP-N-acetylmuramate dehydrogenase [Candidatus Wildermuthbacteria bacterium]|nr:UDP-N-acetylmuramate dehydrogenase [Candidatus Wildermuthbacteria bacterium]
MKNIIEQFLPEARENVSLAPLTTFRIGGPARYFFEARSASDIIQAVRAARAAGMPFFVLAGGSNVLVSERGFPGLVIHIQNTAYEIRDTLAKAEAGVQVATLVDETCSRGLAGFEWAGGLPGSIGGAVRGNAGAFCGEIQDIVESVEALDEQGNIRTYARDECGFSYRSSLFKEKNRIVLSAAFRLRAGDPALLRRAADEHIQYRKDKHPLEYPNAGSVFKNCDVAKFSLEKQKELASVIKTDPFPVVPTAYLISQVNLKGLRVGGAQISEKHPNYMINLGGARARDVLELIESAKKTVKEKYGLELEKEIEYVE